MQLAFNTHSPARFARYPGDDNADTTNRLERTIHLSARSSLPFSGQKARSSNVARDASFPELGRLYFTRRKFLLSLVAGDASGTNSGLFRASERSSRAT